jgi:hypothetical protein
VVAWQEEGGMSAAELRALPVVIHEPPLRRHRPSPSGGGADEEGDIETGERSLSLTGSVCTGWQLAQGRS